ncbi:putative late blight resistance protein homolog R1A-10 [Coffea eugenioides]|uniref:putative late blight resistance protein homolog R1A-10 n=1 Tax=Coffea eugenioides TaxID=49369 RepID=UPI000F61503B|nr:putative late blight resistance protein homolog R1A-10 [Coffea eugenioides]
MHIACKCKGLPHTVVIFAGILSIIERYCWQEFADSLSSSTSMKTEPLELSYSHLPEYLKPCLLYFGAFREDQDIPVQRLLWLWISEGFVQKTEGKSLDDMAEDYLMDLVSRSLVTVTKQRTTGGAKTCRIHDLVHEFCLAKAKNEGFLQILHGDSDISTFTGPCPHRLCIYLIKEEELEKMRLYFPNLRCLFVFSYYHWNFSWKVTKLRDGSPGFPVLKLLRVLDLGDFDFGTSFPMEVVFLAHLRFLAIHGHMKDIPSAIGNLSRLETFLVKGNFDAVVLPNTIWNIKTLRHLWTTNSSMWCGFCLPIDNVEVSIHLDHLNTLSLAVDPFSQSLQDILTKLPSIRRLKCVTVRSEAKSPGNCNKILTLDKLTSLQSLKLQRFVGYEFEYPFNLKKLTLSFNHQPWSKMSAIGELPNLKVLKLECNSFVGEKWEMEEGEFPNLRFLKFSRLDVCLWIAPSYSFLRLEKLVLYECVKLQEVPSSLGKCENLELIELRGCCESAVSSVKQIQQEQVSTGSQDLKIVIRATVD